ncbi:unnamed protein product [Paramecium primaurelia]|uniref:Uncharacterized protein n=2 Tax=Paramecium TaxID=5884 RepID=A0A8S1TZ25_9CILI|nr:unnamed protein product [Paramecium primaurelia]CAD8156912.1 unnamed protein product [Paramecium pentaurelia]
MISSQFWSKIQNNPQTFSWKNTIDEYKYYIIVFTINISILKWSPQAKENEIQKQINKVSYFNFKSYETLRERYQNLFTLLYQERDNLTISIVGQSLLLNNQQNNQIQIIKNKKINKNMTIRRNHFQAQEPQAEPYQNQQILNSPNEHLIGEELLTLELKQEDK